jgi:hypothetical protein
MQWLTGVLFATATALLSAALGQLTVTIDPLIAANATLPVQPSGQAPQRTS